MNNLVSRLGYSDNSPFRNNPYNIINSNNITMRNTSIPLLGIDNLGNKKIMKPNSKKNYMFPGTQVMEIPIGSHQMPDGSIMKNNQMQYLRGGIPCYKCGGKAKKMEPGGAFIGPLRMAQSITAIKPELWQDMKPFTSQQGAVNMPQNMLLKPGEDVNNWQKRQDATKAFSSIKDSSSVGNPFMNPLIGLNVGLRGLAEGKVRQRQNQDMQRQLADNFNQTYSQADNDYGQSDYRYLGYQKGGFFKGGGINALVPYSQQQTELFNTQYNNLYKPPFRGDDGYDKFYHNMLNRSSPKIVKTEGWAIGKTGFTDTYKRVDGNKDEIPTVKAGREARWITENAEFPSNTKESSRVTEYLMQQNKPKFFQSGGSYKPCSECNERKSYAKGGTVSKKYEKFLIDKLQSGVSIEELAAQKLGTVEGLSKYASNYVPRAITNAPTQNIPTQQVQTQQPQVQQRQSNYAASPLIAKSTSGPESTIPAFYKDAKDKADYQKKLQEWYKKTRYDESDDKSYFSPLRTTIPGVTNTENTCIDGVCGIMEKNGKKFNAGNIGGRYIGNGTFYDNAYVKKLEDVYQATGDFQIGDLIQATSPDKAVPWDSKIIVDIDEQGRYITYGGQQSIIGEGSKYSKQELLDYIKKKERMVTRPGYQLDKPKLDAQRLNYNNPEIFQALNERQEIKDFEKSRASYYKYSIPEDAKDYNKNTKEVMDKFVKFANDDEKLNNLVEKTGKTKEEINNSLLNTFGILGQENNWGDKGKGVGSRVENLVEKGLSKLGKGKGLSVGPGQIKLNSIPKKLKEDFDIKSTKDLYDMDKLLPLMVAMDLDNNKTLQNWSNSGVLSKRLFGIDDPNLKLEDLPNSGSYSPYLRNQYSPIAQQKKKVPNAILPEWLSSPEYIDNNNGEMQYRLDKGSYPYKVKQAWQSNLQRLITRPSQLYPDQVIPEEQDYTERDLRPVTVVANKKAKKKFQLGGRVDNYGYPIPTKEQYNSGSEFYGQAPTKQILNKYSSMTGNGTGQPVPDSQYGKLLNNLSYMKNNIWTESNVYRPENMHIAANYNQIDKKIKGQNFAQEGGEIEDEFDSFDFLFENDKKVEEVVQVDNSQELKEIKKQRKLLKSEQNNNLALELANEDYETQDFESSQRVDAGGNYVVNPQNINAPADVMSRAIEGKNYLMATHGLSNELASGLLGNAYAESGFNSGVTNSIGAFGTFQHLGPRKKALFNFAQQRGKDPSDFKTQLDFAVNELNTSHRSANRNYGSAQEAAVGIMNNFEKPAEHEKRQSVSKRVSFANKLAQYKKGGQYEMSQQEINELILKGYKFDII